MSNVFVPRFRREQQQQEQQAQQSAASSPDQQRLRQHEERWRAMQRTINAGVNRVTVENLEVTADDLFRANVLRGRGVFCNVVCAAQLASPHLSDVFAALVARVNSRLPQVGELLLRRLRHQLWRQLRLRDLASVKHTCLFLAHLGMAKVCEAEVILQLLTTFLVGQDAEGQQAAASTNRILIAAAVFAEAVEFLDRELPQALAAVLDPVRLLVEEGQLETRAEEALDGMLKLARQLQSRKEAAAGHGPSGGASRSNNKNNRQRQPNQSATGAGGGAAASAATANAAASATAKKTAADKAILRRIIDEAAALQRENEALLHVGVEIDLRAQPPEQSQELDKFPAAAVAASATPAAQPSANRDDDDDDDDDDNNQQQRSSPEKRLADELDRQDAEYSELVAPFLLSDERRRELEEQHAAAGAARVVATGTIRARLAEDGGGSEPQVLVTPSDFSSLADAATAAARKEIYLIFRSSIRAEEIAHKLLGTVGAAANSVGAGSGGGTTLAAAQQMMAASSSSSSGGGIAFGAAGIGATTQQEAIQRQQNLIVTMIIQTAMREKSFDPIYANTAELLCRTNQVYRANFERALRISYESAAEYEARQLSLLACVFAHLMQRDAIAWGPLAAVRLTREHSDDSQRVFLKHLLLELASHMSIGALAQRLHRDPATAEHAAGMFPTASKSEAMFATAFYQAIGLRQLAAPMDEVAEME